MYKIGILGYGNLGRGVEAAIKKNDDMELVAVIAAAVAAFEGKQSTDGFVVRSIRKARRK